MLNTPDGVYTHVADGLHTDTEVDPRRAALQSFIRDVTALTDLVSTGDGFYSPTRLAIVGAPIETAAVPVEWPDASVRLADAVACTPVIDPSAVDVVASAHAGTGFRQDGVVYQLAARILPPGVDC